MGCVWGEGRAPLPPNIVFRVAPLERTSASDKLEKYHFEYNAPPKPSTTRDQFYELIASGVQINGCMIEDHR